jgi:hypothetical protein
MNWSDYFKQLTLSLIAIPIVTGGTIYLAKLIFDRWFKAREQDYQHKLLLAQKEHEHSLEMMRETHLETLRQINKKDEIRYSKLHETRALVIADIYGKLAEIHLKAFEIIPGGLMGADKALAFIKEVEALLLPVKKSQIYFSDSTNEKIMKILDELYIAGEGKHSFILTRDNAEVRMNELRDTVYKTVPLAMGFIIDEFRALLGVTEN